jgi:zinc protease
VYLYFTQPRKDTTAFESFQSRMIGLLENMSNMPERVFSDTLSTTLSSYHPRSKPVTKAWLESIDLEKAFAFYIDRFKDAGDFTFFFVGNFNTEELQPMVETWLGALPMTGRKETWKDPGVKPPKGVIKKEVHKGIDDKSMVAVVFTGDFAWTYENRYAINSLEELLTIRLREEIREEKGGTYGVRVNASAEKYPKQEFSLSISFGTDPARVEELTGTLFTVLDDVRKNPASQETINKIKEMQRRERETNLKENGWWLGQMRNATLMDEPLNTFQRFDAMVDALDADMLLEAAQHYILMENYVQVALFPEDKPADGE